MKNSTKNERLKKIHNKYDFKKFIYEYTIKVVDMKYTINMISSKRCKKKKETYISFFTLYQVNGK